MKKYIFLTLLGGLVVFYLWHMVWEKDFLQPSIASKILRFHVLANSDSVEDQAVKEKVRDSVGIYLQPFLKESKNLEKTKEIVNEHMEDIVLIAEETLLEHGYDYSVTAHIVKTEFPVKSYGNYTFPEGEYEALQIVIGEGAGQNWWCVLYPNMCFRGSVFAVVEKEAEEALQEVLNSWEYAKVFDSGRVELRFRFLDFFRREN